MLCSRTVDLLPTFSIFEPRHEKTCLRSYAQSDQRLFSLPVHRYSVVNFTFSGPLGLKSRVALNPG